MKKIFIPLMAIAVVAALLLGCMPGAPVTPPPVTPPPVTPPPVTPPPVTPPPVTPPPAPEEKMTMAVATIGLRTDGAWSQGIYEAYLLIKDKYSDICDVTFSDEVAWGDFPVFLEMQGELGTQLLYLDSGQTWGEALKAVAPKYPDTWYAVPGSDAGVIALLPPNVAGYDRKEEQGTFMAGVVAGLMSETNKAAFVGGFDYPQLIRCDIGLELGAKWVNPDAEIITMWAGSWTDAEMGYETGKAAIAMGADVVMHYADNAGLGVLRAAEEEGVWFIGFCRDQYEMSPDIIITSVLTDHHLLAERALLDFRAGTIMHGTRNYTLLEGWPALAPLTNVPDEIKAVIDALTLAIAREEIKVPAVRDPAKLGTVWPEDYGIPSAEELGITLP